MNVILGLTETAVEFLWWGGGWVGWGGVEFAKSFSCLPNNCVEVVLCCVVVGVVTKSTNLWWV